MKKKMACLLVILIILSVFNVKSVVHADSASLYAELKSGQAMTIDLNKCEGQTLVKFVVPSNGSLKIEGNALENEEYSCVPLLRTFKSDTELQNPKYNNGYGPEGSRSISYLSMSSASDNTTHVELSNFVSKGYYYILIYREGKTDYTTGKKVYPKFSLKCTFTPIPQSINVDYADEVVDDKEETPFSFNIGSKNSVTFFRPAESVLRKNTTTYFKVEIPEDGKYVIEKTDYDMDYNVENYSDGITLVDIRVTLRDKYKKIVSLTKDEDNKFLVDDHYLIPCYYELKKGTYFLEDTTLSKNAYKKDGRMLPVLSTIVFHEYSSQLNKVKNGGSSKYSNEWVNGKWYNADGTQTYKGTMTWKNDATGWWIEDSSGWYPTDSWQKIDGIWYFFKPDGYMASNEYYNGYWFNSDGSWDDKYFLSWKSNATGWWVEDISGWWPASSWLKIDGYWYYFDASGYMVTSQYVDGWWIGADGVCY